MEQCKSDPSPKVTKLSKHAEIGTKWEMRQFLHEF